MPMPVFLSLAGARLMRSFRAWLNQYLQEIRSNRNLQYGLLAIALLACGEWGLEWSDGLTAKENDLQRLRGEVRALRTQSRDEAALRSQLSELKSMQEIVDRRLWLVSSDAVGQARLKDWLTTILKSAAAKNYKLVLSSPRDVGAREGSADAESTAAGAGQATAGTAVATSGEGVKSLREVRATVSMAFTPAALEQVLLDIEGGEALAMVESLTVNVRDRKVDMTVRVLLQIGSEQAPVATAADIEVDADDSAARAASDSSDTRRAELPRQLEGAPSGGPR